MNKRYGNNPLFIVSCIVVPWRYFNTFFAIENNNLFLSGYVAQKNSAFFKWFTIDFSLEEISKVGFTQDFDIPLHEEELNGIYGNYKSQEILFETNKGELYFINVRPYTRKQIRLILKHLPVSTQISTKLSKVLRL